MLGATGQKRARILNREKKSMAQMAVENGDLLLLSMLLRHGSSLMVADINCDTCFHAAVKKNDVNALSMLLDHVDEEEEFFLLKLSLKTCLLLACEMDHPRCLVAILCRKVSSISLIEMERLQKSQGKCAQILKFVNEILENTEEQDWAAVLKRELVFQRFFRPLCNNPKEALAELLHLDLWHSVCSFLDPVT